MNSSCVLIGNGIECLTASVVLASLGKTVDLYSQHMPMVLAQYAFEHELIALYHMYVAAGRIVMHDFAEFAISTLEIAALETSTSKI
ncbi:MAG: hypothetical protein Q4G13_01570 [Moraxella sp.]|nr:hypothetical protein [Moraxella sp.]